MARQTDVIFVFQHVGLVHLIVFRQNVDEHVCIVAIHCFEKLFLLKLPLIYHITNWHQEAATVLC